MVLVETTGARVAPFFGPTTSSVAAASRAARFLPTAAFLAGSLATAPFLVATGFLTAVAFLVAAASEGAGSSGA